MIYDKPTGLPLGEALTMLRLKALDSQPRRHLSRLRPGKGYLDRQQAKLDRKVEERAA